VPSMSVEELKERLTRDLPGALAPARAKAEHADNGGAAPQADPPVKPKKGEEGPVDLLATKDAIVLAERIPDVARYVRDTLGYTLLTDLTAVDSLRIRATSASGATCQVRLQAMQVIERRPVAAGGIVCFTYDDSYGSQYSIAKRDLEQRISVNATACGSEEEQRCGFPGDNVWISAAFSDG